MGNGCEGQRISSCLKQPQVVLGLFGGILVVREGGCWFVFCVVLAVCHRDAGMAPCNKPSNKKTSRSSNSSLPLAMAEPIGVFVNKYI